MYACMHVCMYVCMYVCLHACMYACKHVCMYACMYVEMLQLGLCLKMLLACMRCHGHGHGHVLFRCHSYVLSRLYSCVPCICVPGMRLYSCVPCIYVPGMRLYSCAMRVCLTCVCAWCSDMCSDCRVHAVEVHLHGRDPRSLPSTQLHPVAFFLLIRFEMVIFFTAFPQDSIFCFSG